MRRTAASLVALVALSACSTADSDGSDAADGAAPTVPATEPTTALTAPPPAPVDCEVTPDPANYLATAIPPAIRPCEIPTALLTSTLRTGQGRNASDGDTLIVDYVGIRAEDGAIFDDSYSRNVPIEFPLGRGGVIRGWDDGLLGTQAGSMVKIDVPADLAYGDTPPPGDDGIIQPGDALTFVVEVRAVIAPVTADDAPFDIDIPPSLGATEVTVTELVAGDGDVVELGHTAVVHIMLVRGDNQVVLFNTYEASDPFQIVLGETETIPGLFDALPGVRVGSMIAVAMPPEKAFGEQGEPTIGLPAGVDLVAVVEVVGVY